eukprot:2941656-Lingulodinium_polyedra.AAC.1
MDTRTPCRQPAVQAPRTWVRARTHPGQVESDTAVAQPAATRSKRAATACSTARAQAGRHAQDRLQQTYARLTHASATASGMHLQRSTELLAWRPVSIKAAPDMNRSASAMRQPHQGGKGSGRKPSPSEVAWPSAPQASDVGQTRTSQVRTTD